MRNDSRAAMSECWTQYLEVEAMSEKATLFRETVMPNPAMEPYFAACD